VTTHWQPASLKAQGPGDGRERDVHHGGVENHHELRRADQDQQRPRLRAPPRARRRRARFSSYGLATAGLLAVLAARAAGAVCSVHLQSLPRLIRALRSRITMVDSDVSHERAGDRDGLSML
jgi:hypothetical protein